MSAALHLELQALLSCVCEDDADRAREIVGNVAQICLSDVNQRNIGCNRVTIAQHNLLIHLLVCRSAPQT